MSPCENDMLGEGNDMFEKARTYPKSLKYEEWVENFTKNEGY